MRKSRIIWLFHLYLFISVEFSITIILHKIFVILNEVNDFDEPLNVDFLH